MQPKGNHPVRTVTYYQVNTSDLRNLGVSSGVTALFAALGTYLLSVYFDLAKDLQLNNEATEATEMLTGYANIAFGGWLFCWAIAIIAFIWREAELVRIKKEHGVLPWYERLWNRIWNR